jgi:hypothetical protein
MPASPAAKPALALYAVIDQVATAVEDAVAPGTAIRGDGRL